MSSVPSLPSVLSAAAIGIGVSFALYIFRRPRIRIAKSVYLQGMGDLKVIKQTVGNKIHVTLDFGVPKLPFCSAVVTAAGTIYVSGAVGAKMDGGRLMVVPGGPQQEALQTMRTIEACLKACGAGLEHVTMVHAYLVNYSFERFDSMNKGYLEAWGSRPLPSRICTGTDHVGLGGAVEMDAIAQL
ncbi:unnamed protein product [Effrenium voratum]|uniref:YjgF-like protein n=1 Tax=Effrenium voratum TaxID=2562239 RepID=A0AA36MNI3_9DINO|nr:unnamed protein product [Effrenium voratum]CAJ1373607.1 unnamed protein product [Effrenium voratum]CAJ1425305.1 unnamed protein product [Effrenium voratum]